MKFLSHIRSKSRLKNEEPQAQTYYHGHTYSEPAYRSRIADYNPTAQLPQQIFEEIFAAVCPHSRDESYLSSEESMLDGGCMLCDLRDLSHCAMVNRQWAGPALAMLYHSIRIDAVHYCELEHDLSERRKKKPHRFDRNGETEDVPAERLHLLCGTARANQYLADQVLFLKMPYMTRESCVSDLARTVSVLPNLRFVDLPEGIYRDSSSAEILKQELQSRCPDLRKMKYTTGAEGSFSMLPQTRQWQNLEVLELSHLSIEPSTLIYALSSFPVLHQVKLLDLPLLDDTVFHSNPQRVSPPPLTTLSLQDTPNITTAGLLTYLSNPTARSSLTALHLSNTGILIDTLFRILTSAPSLTTLHLTETVSRALPLSPLPPLASRSLHTLHFLISSPPSTISPPSDSYYTYLSTSLLASHLPSLHSLYALSPSLPTLLLPPPSAPFTFTNAPPTNKTTTPHALPAPLNLYTKAILEMEWQYTHLSPPTPHNRRGSATATRPVSLYSEAGGLGGPQLGQQWGGSARDSVLVGNGFGGFLAVPSDEKGGPRPRSRGREIGGWMG